MASILRVKDGDGNIVEIPVMRGPQGPAGDGSGDMLAEVYDPQGKAMDVFAYAADRVSAHNTDVNAHKDIREGVSIVGQRASEALTAAESKAPKDHGHEVSDVTGLEEALNGKAPKEHNHTMTRTATVTAAWTANGDYFYQDIDVEDILATDNPVADILPGDDNAANVVYSENMCKVFRITTSDGSIRVWATKAIETTFPIQLKVVR